KRAAPGVPAPAWAAFEDQAGPPRCRRGHADDPAPAIAVQAQAIERRDPAAAIIPGLQAGGCATRAAVAVYRLQDVAPAPDPMAQIGARSLFAQDACEAGLAGLVRVQDAQASPGLTRRSGNGLRDAPG